VINLEQLLMQIKYRIWNQEKPVPGVLNLVIEKHIFNDHGLLFQ